MRLSSIDETLAIEVIHRAFDEGVTLLDTANVYGPTARDIGHNERLVARALEAWRGDRDIIRVATKGGLTRPNTGRWVPDGRGKALTAACEASVEALGVTRIDLYQLHAVDPKTKLATSLRALVKLQSRGLVRDIGLCNVNLAQLDEALALTEISAVQVSLSVFDDAALRNGVAERCRERGIALIAHSPLGGSERAKKLANEAVLAKVASRHHASAAQIALAWLADLDPRVITLPGATRVETASDAARGQALELTANDRAALDARFAAGRRFRLPQAQRRPKTGAPEDVVMLVGMPGAGKSSVARDLVEEGFTHLSRDVRGGKIAALTPELDAMLSAGSRVVLDNTHGTRISRRDFIDVAWERGVDVRCVWVSTAIEDAQVNACVRMIEKHGRLLSPDEMKKVSRRDPNSFPPRAQFDYRRAFEPPALEEGFSEIEERAFTRESDRHLDAAALIVEYDGVLRRSRSGRDRPVDPEDVEILPGRAEILRQHREAGTLVLGVSWQPEVESGETTQARVAATFAKTHDLLGVAIDVLYCPHEPGPPRCWCRKPLPGLGVAHILAHRLDAQRCTFVGRNSTDATFARRIGFDYVPVETFFG